MSDIPRRRGVDAARSLEAAGYVDGAVEAYIEAGAPAEAARVLVSAGRWLDAGELLLRALRIAPAEAGKLQGTDRQLAHRAAICLARAGDVQRSYQMLIALGDRVRAEQVLAQSPEALRTSPGTHGGAAAAPWQPSPSASWSSAPPPHAGTEPPKPRLSFAPQGGRPATPHASMRVPAADGAIMQAAAEGRFADAAKMLWDAGRFHEAADFFVKAGMAYEASVCLHRAGDAARCLEALVRVPADHARYRRACAHAVEIAAQLGTFDFDLDHFLTPFVRSGVREPSEIETFLALAQLYRAHGFPDSAREVARKILGAAPTDARAQGLLAELDRTQKGERAGLEKIAMEEVAFRETGSRKLPELPSIDAAPARSVRPQTPVASGAPAHVSIPRVPPASSAAGGTPARKVSSRPPTTASEADADGDTLPPPARPPGLGDLVANRYKLVGELGAGGMSVVFRAKDAELDQDIALKLFPQSRANEQLLSRFRQELALARELQHKNIVRVYDIGTHDGFKFITMELLQGESLFDIMGRGVPMGTAIQYMLQACAGLRAAHEAGVVHRDIKPENLFVTKDGTLKLMDFGIAKAPTEKKLTVAGMVLGTPEYMSPEQIDDSGSVSALSDLYSLGVLMYELFTGTLPFESEQLFQLLRKHANEAPEPPTRRNPMIPPELEEIILELLEKDPAKRIQSCADVAKRLRAIVQLMR